MKVLLNILIAIFLIFCLIYLGLIFGIGLAAAGLVLAIFHVISWIWATVMIIVGIIIAIAWYIFIVWLQYKNQEENPALYSHLGP